MYLKNRYNLCTEVKNFKFNVNVLQNLNFYKINNKDVKPYISY